MADVYPIAKNKAGVLDISGQVFGRLTAISRGQYGKWQCLCSCGAHTWVDIGKLRNGHTKSCGCLLSETSRANGKACLKDRVGIRYGRWIVMEYAGIERDEASWLCRCDCGVEKVVRGANLHSGGSKSCGCLARENSRVVSRLNFKERHALNRLENGRGSALCVYRSYIRGAKSRGLEFKLSVDAFLELASGRCSYCDSPPNRVTQGRRAFGAFAYNGIDRVDNNIGYVEGNMVPCCTRCNSWKQNLSLSQFAEHIARIHASLSERARLAVAVS